MGHPTTGVNSCSLLALHVSPPSASEAWCPSPFQEQSDEFFFSFFDSNSPRIDCFPQIFLRLNYPIQLHENLLSLPQEQPSKIEILTSRIHQLHKHSMKNKTSRTPIKNSNHSTSKLRIKPHDWCVCKRTQHYENLHTSISQNKFSIRKISRSFFLSPLFLFLNSSQNPKSILGL